MQYIFPIIFVLDPDGACRSCHCTSCHCTSENYILLIELTCFCPLWPCRFMLHDRRLAQLMAYDGVT